MDRLAAPSGRYSITTESETAGWDAQRVWAQRVHEPRQRRRLPRIAATDIAVAPEPAGWDPFETWRRRVQRARRRP